MYPFLNCMVLAYAPFVIIYRSTKLMEESALKACGFGALGYAATQVAKMYSMATLIAWSVDSSDGSGEATNSSSSSITSSIDTTHIAPIFLFNATQELMKSVLNIVEVIGIQITLTYTPSLSKYATHTRITAIALGWSCAQSVALYLIPIWIGARGMEFSWKYIEMGVSSNINIAEVMALVTVVWLRSRADLTPNLFPIVVSVIGLHCGLPSIYSYLENVALLSSWNVLFIRGIVGVASLLLGRVLIDLYINTTRGFKQSKSQ